MIELPSLFVGCVIFGGGLVAGLGIAASLMWAVADLVDRPGKY